jgi:hypothetical protein
MSWWMLELQRANATDDFALGAARFREMLKATEGVNLPLDVLEKAGREDLQRNLEALKEDCKHYAPDAYYGHFKCNRNRIVDFPNLSRYLQRLYQMPGIAATVNMDLTTT